jgi:hypothetical protein
MVPKHTYIIITLLGTIYSALYRVAIVIDDEYDGLEAVANIASNLLNCHLERAFTDEQDDTSGELEFFLGDESTESGTDGVADRGPEYLRDVAGVGGESRVGDAELRGAGFGKDDVVGLEKAADTLPGVGLLDYAGGRGV